MFRVFNRRCYGGFFAVIVILLFTGISMAATTFPRQDIRLDGIWRYYKGNASGASAVTFADASWDTVCLPHTANLESGKVHGSYDYYLGDCWYRKSFVPDTSFKGKKVFLEVEAAMQVCTVYVNGTLKTTHLGGYSPFTIDISSDLQMNATNVIAIHLNNNASASFPPGSNSVDFYYYGGLYRYVNLHVVDSLHITDAVYANKIADGGIFVTDTLVSTSSATVRVKTNVINEHGTVRSCVLKSTLVDSSGNDLQSMSSTIVIPAGKDSTFSQSFIVINPRLWHPDTPNLYSIRSEVYDSLRPADIAKTTIGIKTISYTRSGGFVINGARLIGRGANHHQDYASVGNAVPASGQYRDALRLKEAGFNFVRLSHYIQSPAFLDACDKLGVMVCPSLTGWQQGSLYSNTSFFANALKELHTLVRYYRNHPSIIMWECVINESTPTAAFSDSANRITHAEYPGSQTYTIGQDANSKLDIYWAAVQQGGRTYSTTKPGGVSEYGHWEYGGYTGQSQRPRSSGDTGMVRLAMNQARSLDTNRRLSWLSVDAVWVYNDYFGFPQYTNSLCGGGVVDQYRTPKLGYYFYQSQRDPAHIIPGVSSGPMVYIANFWTSSSPTTIKVFSNCTNVSLYLNDSLLGTKMPDSVTTPSLEHAPFSFTVSAYRAGTLRANGLINGVVVASDTVKTPVAAAKVKLTIDTANQKLMADGSDWAIVYASIIDTNGTVMPLDSSSIVFTVSGPGKILAGDGNPVRATCGITAVYVQTKYNQPGLITISASAAGLPSGSSGSATVRSVSATNSITGIGRWFSFAACAAEQGFALTSNGKLLHITLPHEAIRGATSATFILYTVQGRAIRSWKIPASTTMQITAGALARGVYLGRLMVDGHEFASRILTIKD